VRIRYCITCWSRINDSDYEKAHRRGELSSDDYASAASRFCYACFRNTVEEPIRVVTGAASTEPASAITRRKPK
jgi:hypothetical protein